MHPDLGNERIERIEGRRGSREGENPGKCFSLAARSCEVTNCPPSRSGYGVLDTEDAGSLQRADSIRHRAKRASLLVFGTSALMMALIVYMVVTGDDQKQVKSFRKFICRQSAFLTFRDAQAASAPSKKPVATQVTPPFIVSSELRKL